MSPEQASNLPACLLTGASGGLSRLVAKLLQGRYEVIGVDPRAPAIGDDFPGPFYQIDYTHRKMNELFRKHRFDAVLHLGRARPTHEMSHAARFNLNVLGTRNLLELCQKFKVPRALVFSTFHVYGAQATNHFGIVEEEPLRATQSFPQLSDAVELDSFSITFMLQHPEVITTVIRPCNVVGSNINNEISQILRQDRCPMLMGYDPMLQFIHERDLACAIVLTLEAKASAVYNIAGEGVVPYSHAIRYAGSRPFLVPHMLAYSLVKGLNRFGLTRVPEHLMDYIRYPVILNDEKFRKTFDFKPGISTVDALRSLRRPSIPHAIPSDHR